MVAAPLSFESGTTSGTRPLDLRRDVPQVLALLTRVFRSSVDGAGRQQINALSLGQYPWPLLYLRQWIRGTVPGFVWEEEGRVVGNVSLLTTRRAGRYLIANVAVDPHYRRRGIAQTLMMATLDHVETQGGREVLLQVADDNEGAIRLYERLGFITVGSMTSWRTHHSRILPLPVPVTGRSPDRFGDFLLRPLRKHEWEVAWQVDRRALAPDLTWPVPLPRDAYRRNWWQRLDDLLNGRQVECWAAESPGGELVALGVIHGEWARTHRLALRVLPAWRGQVERVLLAKLLRRVRHLTRRDVQLEHPAEDEKMVHLLREANFVPRRTLTVMRFDY